MMANTANSFGQQVSSLEKKYEDIGQLTNIKNAKEQIEGTRKDLVDLFTTTTVSTSDKEKLDGLAQKVDRIIQTCQSKIDKAKEAGQETQEDRIEATIGKLTKQKEAIDKMMNFLNKLEKCRDIDPITPEYYNKDLWLKDVIGFKKNSGIEDTDRVSHKTFTVGLKPGSYGFQKNEDKSFTISQSKGNIKSIIGNINIDKNRTIRFTPHEGATRENDIVIELNLSYQLPLSDIDNGNQQATISNTKKITIAKSAPSQTESKSIINEKGETVRNVPLLGTGSPTNPKGNITPHIDKSGQIIRPQNDANATTDAIHEDDANALYIKEKLLKSLYDLDSRADKVTTSEEKKKLQEEFKDLWYDIDRLSPEFKESITKADGKKPKNINDLIKKTADSIVRKLRGEEETKGNAVIPYSEPNTSLIPYTPESGKDKTTSLPTTSKEVMKKTADSLKLVFDANFQDKFTLIQKEVENKIKNKAQKDYMTAGAFKRLGMYIGNRRKQKRRSENEMNARTNTNQFIENDHTLQSRIEGNIGTHVSSHQIGLDDQSITRTSLGTDDRVDDIAHSYLTGAIDRATATAEFNAVFASDARFSRGHMTGTDIMAQLDSDPSLDYGLIHSVASCMDQMILHPDQRQNAKNAIQTLCARFPNKTLGNIKIADKNNISDTELDRIADVCRHHVFEYKLGETAEKNLRIRVNLRGVDKTAGPELESSDYNNINNRRHKLAKGINNTIGLKGSTRVPKTIFAIGFGVAGGITGIAAGPVVALSLTGIGAVLQRAKSHSDAMKEIAKTHEDYLAMGGAELQQTITKLEQEKQKADGFFSKAGAIIGLGKKARASKKLRIARSLNALNREGVMIPAETAITNLATANANNLSPIIDTLARIDAGHYYETHFFTSDSRDHVTTQRHRIMQALTQSAITAGLVPHGTSLDDTATREQAWENLRTNPATKQLYEQQRSFLGQAYEQVEKDITSTRKKIAQRDMANYVAVSGGSAIVTGLASAAVHHFTGAHDITTGTVETHTTRLEDKMNYDLGQYKDGHSVSDTLGQLKGNETITITGESAVDGVRALHSFKDVVAHAEDLRQTIAGSNLTDQTKKAFLDAISPSKMDEIMKIARESAIAQNGILDEGNQRLVFGRWVDGIKDTFDTVNGRHMTNLNIKEIRFDTNTFADMAIQATGSTGPVQSHRMFGAVVDVMNTVDTRVTTHVAGDLNPWFIPIPYANPTYAAQSRKTADLVETRDGTPPASGSGGKQTTINDTTNKTSDPKKRDSGKGLYQYSPEDDKRRKKNRQQRKSISSKRIEDNSTTRLEILENI